MFTWRIGSLVLEILVPIKPVWKEGCGTNVYYRKIFLSSKNTEILLCVKNSDNTWIAFQLQDVKLSQCVDPAVVQLNGVSVQSICGPVYVVTLCVFHRNIWPDFLPYRRSWYTCNLEALEYSWQHTNQTRVDIMVIVFTWHWLTIHRWLTGTVTTFCDWVGIFSIKEDSPSLC